MFELVFSNKLLSHRFFIVVKQTKLKVVDLSTLVEIYFFEDKAVIRHGYMNPHLNQTRNKLLKIQSAVEVFVETAEALSETFEFFENSIAYVLQKQVNSSEIFRLAH